MSESLIHQSVAAQIHELAELADAPCEYFQHQVIDSKVTFPSPPVEQDIFNIAIAPNTALVITSLEIKALYDTTDTDLVGDFRATDDLNPYGPLFGSGSDVGQV